MCCLVAMVYVVTWAFGVLMVIWCTPRDQLQEMVKTRGQRVREALARAAASSK